jgi:hypothetical protein
MSNYFSNPFGETIAKPELTGTGDKPVGSVDIVDFSILRDQNYNLFVGVPPKFNNYASANNTGLKDFVPISGINKDTTGKIKNTINEKMFANVTDEKNNKLVHSVSELAEIDPATIINKMKTKFTKTEALVFLNGVKNIVTAYPVTDPSEINDLDTLIASVKAVTDNDWLSSPIYLKVKALAVSKQAIIDKYNSDRAKQFAANVGRGFGALAAGAVAAGVGTAGVGVGIGLGAVAAVPAAIGKMSMNAADRYSPDKLITDLQTVLKSAKDTPGLNAHFKTALEEVENFIGNPGQPTNEKNQYFKTDNRTLTSINGNELSINFDDETKGTIVGVPVGIGSKFRRMRTNLQYAIKLINGRPKWNIKSGLGLSKEWEDPADFIRDISMYSYKDPKALHGSNMMGVELKAFQGGKTRKHKKSKTQKGGRRHKKTRKH